MSLFVGLMSFISNDAWAVQKNIGTLESSSDWRIGTVTADDGTIYCAMVNQYDDDTVLAFSRNRYGTNSVAVDFKEPLLVEGVKYAVNFEVDKVKTFRSLSRDYSGTASSNNSLVVNTGDDKVLFDELAKDGRLKVETSAVEAAFNIKNFLSNYTVLLDCAGSLKDGPAVAAVPVDGVDKVDLANDYKDRIDAVKSDYTDKYKSLKEKLEYDITRQKEQSAEKIGLLNEKYHDLEKALEEQKRRVESLKSNQQEQAVAKKAMEEVIRAKDAEIERLKLAQKEHLQLIEDLTKQKQELMEKEKKAEGQQVDLTNLLTSQKAKLVELEAKSVDYDKISKELSDKIADKEKEVAILQDKLKNEEQERLSKFSERSDELSNRVKTLEDQNRDLLAQIDAAKMAARTAEENIIDKKNLEIESLVKDYSNKIVDLKERLSSQQIEKQKVEEELKLKQIEIENIRKASLERGNKEIEEKRAHEKELEERIKGLEDNNSKLQSEIESARSVVKDAEDKMINQRSSELISAVGKHKDRVAELEARYRDQENAKRDLQRQLDEKEREINSLYQDNLDRSKAKVNDLLLRENELYSRVQTLESENKSLKYQIDEAKRAMLNVQNMSAEDKRLDFAKILSQHQARVEELQKKYDEQQLVEKELRDQLAAKDKELSEISTDAVESKNQMITDLVTKEKDLTETVERLKFENERLQNDINTVRQAFYKSGYTSVNADDASMLPEDLTKQIEKSSEIAEEFSKAKRDYDDKLRKLIKERKDLLERIEMLQLENKSYKEKTNDVLASSSSKASQYKEMENRMLEMAKQREELKDNLKAQEQQTKVLEAALKAKEQTLESKSNKFDDTSEKLNKVRSELIRIKNEKDAAISDLESKLAETTDKYELLRSQFDGKMSLLSKEHQLVADIALQEETVASLKKAIADTDLKRTQTIQTIAKLKDIERNKSDKLQSVAEERSKKSKSLLDSLTGQRTDILSKLSAARSARDRLKRELSGSVSSSAPINLRNSDSSKGELVADIKNQLSNLEVELASAGQQKQELSDRLDAKEKELKDKEDRLKAEEQELVSVKVMFPATRRKLEDVRSQLDQIEMEKKRELGMLRGQLQDKVAEYKALENDFDKKSQLMPNVSKMEIELNLQESNITKLEESLAEVNMKLKKATSESEEAEKIIDEKQVEFAEDTKVRLATSEELAVKLNNEYDKYQIKLQQESKKLDDMNAELAEVAKREAPLKDVNAQLQQQLTDATTHISSVELELNQAQEENKKLAAKIEEITEKNAPLMGYKDKIQDELVQAKARIASTEFDLQKSAEEKERLAAQLQAQKEIIDSLRKEAEANSKNVPQNFKNSVELELKKEEIQRLQGEIIDTRQKYTEAMQRVFDIQSKVADLNASRSAEAEGTSKQLLDAEAVIYDLKRKLTEMQMQQEPINMQKDQAVAELEITKARLTDLEAEMVNLAQQKQQLAVRLEERNQQVFSLQDDLARKEQEIVDLRNVLEESNKKLTDARREMDNLKPEYQAVVNDLVVQLKNKISQYDDLQKKYNEHVSAIPEISEVEAELSSNRDNIMNLETKLAQVNEERRKAQEEAIRARAALEKAYIRMDSLNGSFTSPAVVNDKISKVDRKQELQLDQITKEKTLENAELSLKRQTREKEVEEKKESQRKIAEIKNSQVKPLDNSDKAKKTLSKAEDFLNRVMSYHRPGATPEPLPEPKNSSSYYPAQPADLMAGAIPNESKKINLQDLLNISGLKVESYTPVEELSNNVVSQWQSDRISGMYEQVPLKGNFEDQVSNFIGKYRSDCNSGLKEMVTPAESSKAGNIIRADVECSMDSNSYANSLLFLENKGGFIAITHTAYPTEKARVRTIRDSMVRNLERSQGFVPPVSMEKSKTSGKYKFNISDSEAEDKNSSKEEELETIVIQ